MTPERVNLLWVEVEVEVAVDRCRESFCTPETALCRISCRPSAVCNHDNKHVTIATQDDLCSRLVFSVSSSLNGQQITKCDE